MRGNVWTSFHLKTKSKIFFARESQYFLQILKKKKVRSHQACQRNVFGCFLVNDDLSK